MSSLGLLFIGTGALLVWAGFTGANLWEETKAVFMGANPTPPATPTPLPPVKVPRV